MVEEEIKGETGGGFKDGVQVEWHDAGMHDDVLSNQSPKVNLTCRQQIFTNVPVSYTCKE